MSVYETSITNPKKQLEFYKDLSEQLQQENQILKRNCNIGYEELNFYRKEYKKLKSVLDEIKEYIANNKETSIIYTGEVWSESVDARDLEEILDKVK